MIDQLNITIDSWIIALDRYSFVELCTQPSLSSWSIGQLYLHLIGDTGFYIEQIEKCLQSVENVDEQPNENGTAMLAANAFPDIKIVGHPSNADIPQPANIGHVKTDLLAIRKTLNELYLLSARQSAQGKSKHPGLGYLSASQWLQFTDMHFRHHLRQKERIDNFLGKA